MADTERPTDGLQTRGNTTSRGDVLRLVSGASAAQVIGILASPILTRLYPADAFGVAALFTSLTTIVSVVACLSYEQTIVIASDDRRAANLLCVSICLAVLVASLMVPVIWFAGPYILQWIGVSELAPYLWLIPLAILIHGIFSALSCWNTRTKHFGRLSITLMCRQVTSTSATLGAGFAGYSTAGPMIAANVGGQGVAAAVLGGQIWRDHWTFFANAVRWKELIAGLYRYRSFPIFRPWSSLLNSASWQLPVLMLGAFFSPAIVGFYALGFRIIQMPMSLIGKAISQVFFQRASREKSEGDLAPLVEKTFSALLTMALLPCLLLTIIGEDLFAFVFGPAWSEAGVFVQILAPWAFVWFVSSPLSSLYFVLEKQKEEIGLQASIFVTRVLAIWTGGMLGEPRLAVALFAVSGIFAYGYLVVILFRFVGMEVKKVLLGCISIGREAAVFALPVVSIKLLGLHVIVLLLASLLVLSISFFRHKRVFIAHEKVQS